MEAILAGVAGERAMMREAVTYGRSQSKNLFSLRSDQLQIELAADQRSQRWVVALFAGYIDPLVSKVANAGCETKAQRMAECKDVIGEASGIGVMLIDPQIGLMVEQAIENMASHYGHSRR